MIYEYKDSHRYCWKISIVKDDDRLNTYYLRVWVDGKEVDWFDVLIKSKQRPTLEMALRALTRRLAYVRKGFLAQERIVEDSLEAAGFVPPKQWKK
jgi:hypothetical protein